MKNPPWIMRKSKNRALDESKAPVSIAKIRPECAGNVLDSWNADMNTNGPPMAKRK